MKMTKTKFTYIVMAVAIIIGLGDAIINGPDYKTNRYCIDGEMYFSITMLDTGKTGKPRVMRDWMGDPIKC